MLFMVIEKLDVDDAIPVYQRVRDNGRALPLGLHYIDSWVEVGFGRCFQLMECDDAALLQEWALQWRGLGARFEVVPVLTSAQMQALAAPHLSEPTDNERREP